MFGLGAGEVLLIFIIALIVLGPKKLPELAKSLGKSVRDFQDAMSGINKEIEQTKKTIASTDLAENTVVVSESEVQNTPHNSTKEDQNTQEG